jgi:hypothetical protein
LHGSAKKSHRCGDYGATAAEAKDHSHSGPGTIFQPINLTLVEVFSCLRALGGVAYRPALIKPTETNLQDAVEALVSGLGYAKIANVKPVKYDTSVIWKDVLWPRSGSANIPKALEAMSRMRCIAISEGRPRVAPAGKAARLRVGNKRSPLAFPRPVRRGRKYRRRNDQSAWALK